MTQEDKQLLLKDLCGRLPYGVIGLYTWKNKRSYDKELTGNLYDELESSWNSIAEDSQFLPYLRPMSSMTEAEYKSVSWEGCSHTYNYSSKSGFRFVEIKTFTLNILNWLNAHHFDYRKKNEKGLALEVSEKDM